MTCLTCGGPVVHRIKATLTGKEVLVCGRCSTVFAEILRALGITVEDLVKTYLK